MDKYIESEIEETRIARQMLIGEPPQAPKLWHTEGVPTVYHALCNLAPQHGIDVVEERITPIITEHGQEAYTAVVKVKRGNDTRYGAAISSQPEVVTMLAARNGIRQILYGEM